MDDIWIRGKEEERDERLSWTDGAGQEERAPADDFSRKEKQSGTL